MFKLFATSLIFFPSNIKSIASFVYRVDRDSLGPTMYQPRVPHEVNLKTFERNRSFSSEMLPLE